MENDQLLRDMEARANLYLRLSKAMREVMFTASELAKHGDKAAARIVDALGGQMQADVAPPPSAPDEVFRLVRSRNAKSLAMRALAVVAWKPGLTVPEITSHLKRCGVKLPPKRASDRVRGALWHYHKSGDLLREDGRYSLLKAKREEVLNLLSQ